MAPSGPPGKAEAKAAASKPAAKPKAGGPKKEKKAVEEEKPRLEAPDQDAHSEKLGAIQAVIDKLKKEDNALMAQIQGKSAGKEEFFQQKALIRQELDQVSGQMNELQEQKKQINEMLGEKGKEKLEMKQELGKMKKSMNCTSEADIDDRIATIEFKLWTESVSLKVEKDYMAEIKELKKNKPKVSKVSQLENTLKDFDAGGDLHGKRKELNEQMSVLFSQKKEISGRLQELADKRKEHLGDFGEVQEKRNELQKQIQEKMVERTKLRDEFGEAKREFQNYLAEQRKIKQQKYDEDRKEKEQWFKIQRLEKEVEKLDEQPFVAEIVLIEQTMAFCKGLLPQDNTGKAEEKKETVYNNKEGETVLLTKDNREEEWYFTPKKKGKAAKAAKKSETEPSKKPIKHNAETFKLFDSLKLDAPITTADIPALLEQLEKQYEEYQAKVKDWQTNKEEMKRKIMEGKVTVEEINASKEEEKEPEKAEEKEEDKEDEKEEEKEKEEEEKEEEKEAEKDEE